MARVEVLRLRRCRLNKLRNKVDQVDGNAGRRVMR
jgi:hypothetical protein